MTEHEPDLEQALRRALRPLDPGREFATRVVAALDSSAPPVAHKRRVAIARWVPIALAASVLAGIGIHRWQRMQIDEQRGLEARTQTLQALQIASQNLDAVHRMVIQKPPHD